MKKIWLENGLSIVIMLLFLLFLVAESLVGWRAYNNERLDHNERSVSYATFLSTGRFIEATTENWESEFLEMAGYAVLTALLFQKGSAESRKLPGEGGGRNGPREKQVARNAPWPVRRGGWVLTLYENSLSLGFLLLFLCAFFLHAFGGMRDYNLQQLEHGAPPVTLWGFMSSAEFWFQSLQNWQSEFLGLAGIVLMSIFLRQKGSPQSKAVEAPHSETGA